jgi:methyl-accepting chemotaxis protein
MMRTDGPQARHAIALRRGAIQVLKPGLILMGRLQLKHKLMAMGIMLLAPMVLLYGLSMHKHQADIAYVNGELEALDLSDHLTRITADTQQLRAHFVRGGQDGAGAAPELAGLLKALSARIDAFDKQQERIQAFSVSAPWVVVRGKLLSAMVAQQAGRLTSMELDTVIASMNELNQLIAELSGLVLDPEAKSYQLMDILINSVPNTLEAASRLHHESSRSQASWVILVTASHQLAEGVEQLNRQYEAYARAGGEIPLAWQRSYPILQRSSAQMTAQADAGPGMQQATMGDLSAESVHYLNLTEQEVEGALRRELLDRHGRIVQMAVVESAAFMVGLFGLIYLISAFSIVFKSGISQILEAVAAMARGDFSYKVKLHGRDELAEVAQLIDQTMDGLSRLVAEIRNSAAHVSLTGERVADGSARLAYRTEEQASSLRSSVAAISQLSAAVDTNSEAAQALHDLTSGLLEKAVAGQASMTDSVGLMNEMEVSSIKVFAIVKVLDNIAFQTGMLSLNASIEASKAGDNGKGFSVVASEVRQLAQQCATSAEDIRRLIISTKDLVKNCAGTLGSASNTLREIVQDVERVSSRLGVIAESSIQQSAGIKEVRHSVGGLDEITRENAVLVEDSTTSSNGLLDRASRLRQAVGTMRLRQGSPQEAIELVRRAVAHVKQVGRSQAIDDFHRQDTGFIDRDLYVFACDKAGRVMACGAKPEIIGQSANAMPGLGEVFVTRAWHCAQSGGGWISYEYVDPLSQQVLPKESYVLDSGCGFFIGCGIYRQVMCAIDGN